MLSLVCCVCFTTIADLARFYRAFYGFSELAVTVFGVFGRWFLAQKSAVDELASHSHQQYVTANPNTGTYTTRLDFNEDARNLAIFPQVMTGDTGGNLPHNNMPPVYGTYLFKRIS